MLPTKMVSVGHICNGFLFSFVLGLLLMIVAAAAAAVVIFAVCVLALCCRSPFFYNLNLVLNFPPYFAWKMS